MWVNKLIFVSHTFESLSSCFFFHFSSTKSKFQVIRSLRSNAIKKAVFCSPQEKGSLSSYVIFYLNCSFAECSVINSNQVIQDVVISKELPITSCLSLGSSDIFLLVCVGVLYGNMLIKCVIKKDRMHLFCLLCFYVAVHGLIHKALENWMYEISGWILENWKDGMKTEGHIKSFVSI